MRRLSKGWGVVLVLALSLVLAGGGAAVSQAQVPSAEEEANVGATIANTINYVGLLKPGGVPVTGTRDFQFSLWTASSSGSMIAGSTRTVKNVYVSGGLYRVRLDFGSAFNAGQPLWLNVAYKLPTAASYTDYLPRDIVTWSPYALWARAVGPHNHSGANITSGTIAAARIDAAIARTSQIIPTVTAAGFITQTQASSLYAPKGHDHSGAAITSGTVAEARLDPAIARDSEITPTVSAAGFITRTLANSLYTGRYANVVVVAKSGGDFTSVQAALDSITTASATNPFLVWVAPGVYSETVTMTQYVDIEGAGELATKITSAIDSEATGTVMGANNAELRFLTVENSGGAGHTYARALYNDHASPRITHITASASGATHNHAVYNKHSSPTMSDVTASASGGTSSAGVHNHGNSSPTMSDVAASASGGTSTYGVYNGDYSSPTMTDVTASASGGTNNYGVCNGNYSSPTMSNCVIKASGGTSRTGIRNEGQGATVTIDNCQVTADTYTIVNPSGWTTNVGASKLDGPVSNGGTLNCVASYSASYNALGSTCQ